MISKFGLPVLDDAMGGGVPQGHVIILEEDTGLNSDVLVSLFVAGGLLGEEHVFVLNTDYQASTVETLLSAQGIDVTGFERKGRLAFMSAFGTDEPTSEKIFSVIPNISDLREIYSKMKDYSDKLKSEDKFRGVIDSLSTIILSSGDAKGVFSFVRGQVILQKKRGGIILLTLHKRAHSHRFVSALEHLVDGVIEIRRERYYRDSRSILQIRKMEGTRFSSREYAYVIHEGKFVVE